MYFTALLSAWGTYQSAQNHPIMSQKRFFCTWIILILNFPAFLKFKDLGTELFLQIPIFGLFVLWDVLKEKEYPSEEDVEKKKMRSRRWVTVRWTLLLILVFVVFNLVSHPSLIDYGFLIVVYAVMILYRVNKNKKFVEIKNLDVKLWVDR